MSPHNRTRLSRLLGRIALTRSTIAAFRLAAENDRFTAPKIAWPDLMQALETLLPPEQEIEGFTDSLFREEQRGPGN